MQDNFAIEVWPAEQRQITQSFGGNEAVYRQFGLPGHSGIDFGGREGSRIFNVTAGVVSSVGFDAKGYGNHVRVQHPNGFLTIYAHLQQVQVKTGDQLAAGAVIGLLGNTGFSSGPHLHFELRGPREQSGWPNRIWDPTPYLLPHMGFTRPQGPYSAGWVVEWAVSRYGELAQANAGGVSLRGGPGQSHTRLDVVPAGTMMIVTGGGQNQYLPVEVPRVAAPTAPPPPSAPPPPPPPKPSPEFPPMVSTVDGWAFATNIKTENGVRGLVGQYGINLRAAPRRDGVLIGLLREGASVTISGATSGEYVPVKAARTDFMGEINIVEVSPAQPAPGVLSARGPVSAEDCLGWGWTPYLDVRGTQAIVGEYGINLRTQSSELGERIGVVKGRAVVTIVGPSRNEYTPVLVKRVDMLSLASPLPQNLEQPEPFGTETTAVAPPPPPVIITPPHQSTPGWVLSTAVSFSGETAVAGEYGLNLRAAARRDAENLGFIPAGTRMIIVGKAEAEYLPVRVDNQVLGKPLASNAAPAVGLSPVEESAVGSTGIKPPNPEPPLLGHARLGLHAAATPHIPPTEFAEFASLRPGMIKVLSFHSKEDIARLAREHPQASWVVRAFLSMKGRNISPDQFVNDTLSDVRRSLEALHGRDVVVELHNEPNLTDEGLGSSWQDGASFNLWWLQVLGKYRQALPGVRYLFPGLSPGQTTGQRHADRPFLEACRPSVLAADGLAMHAYWSNPHYPMHTHPDSGLPLVDDYIRRFPSKPIWITEASNNLGDDWDTKAKEYITFWQALQRRPTVQGVTYFVASAHGDDFKHETWLGRGIARKLGAR
jgi:hypothetical protein